MCYKTSRLLIRPFQDGPPRHISNLRLIAQGCCCADDERGPGYGRVYEGQNHLGYHSDDPLISSRPTVVITYMIQTQAEPH